MNAIITNGFYENTSVPASVPVKLDVVQDALNPRGYLERTCYLISSAKELRRLARIADKLEKQSRAAGHKDALVQFRNIKINVFRDSGDMQISSCDFTDPKNLRAI